QRARRDEGEAGGEHHLPQAHGPARGVRPARRIDRHQPLPQRRDHPPRRGPAVPAQVAVPATDALLGALDLEPVGEGRYRAGNAASGQPVIFGGQLLAQSVVAALRADGSDKRVKTIYTVFARGGSTDAQIELAVDTLHQGRAFASHTVTI